LGDGRIGFRVTRRAPTVVASRVPGAAIRVNGVAAETFREIFAPGDQILVSVLPQQLSFDGRSTFTFTGWSDGGAASHVVIARAGPPDTLQADFLAAHRVRVNVTGPGSVTSSSGSVVGPGAFLPAGSTVDLTATPAPGAEFIGWRGDSASLSGAMHLPVNHPWDLTALFAATVTVDPAAAVLDLLGGPPLAADARAYLDAIGNRNGSYDVGDYLAWLQRTGQRVPPALSRLRAARRHP
jgi:hypothetical protein